MSNLSIKTKNNLSPQGKPRVYFECHPADFEKYFDTICEDIFASQDCAIYYESDRENIADEDEIRSRLSDMQLIVIPITTKFLTEDCIAKSLVYGYAMEQHIPILPIAVENGIAEIFAEIMNRLRKGFGDVQFLDRTSMDHTEIPYAEKLKSRLETVLIGNELTKRVRAAFDAYIFLSYRKKDREKAKKLMALIHEIPFCRNIAIWYDEYLIPGEAWNEAITEVLQKSKLVTLMVTPSVIEPGNFIIEHEYPDAIAAGKKVLPAEVVPTEREAIFKLFPGIPTPFDGTQKSVLADKLKSIAATESENSPEHNYLIGLAYLGAIDVEKNTKRAVELITSAAREGLSEAMKKLSDMFFVGEGVKRDYTLAGEWAERYALCFSGDDIVSELDAYDFAAERWNVAAKPEKALKMYEYGASRASLVFVLTPSDIIGEYMLQFNLASARAFSTLYVDSFENGCGEEQRSQYKKSASDYLEKVLISVGKIDIETCPQDRRLALSEYFWKISHICNQIMLWNEAHEYAEKSLVVLENLWEAPGLDDYQKNDLCVRLFQKYNQMYRLSPRYKGYIEKAKKFCDVIDDESQNSETKMELVDYYFTLGLLKGFERNWIEARKYYEKALDICRNVTNELETIGSKISLSSALDKMVSLCLCEKNYSEAMAFAHEMYDVAAFIFEETDGTYGASIVAKAFFNYGLIYEEMKQYRDAMDYFLRSQKIVSLPLCVNAIERVSKMLEEG